MCSKKCSSHLPRPEHEVDVVALALFHGGGGGFDEVPGGVAAVVPEAACGASIAARGAPAVIIRTPATCDTREKCQRQECEIFKAFTQLADGLKAHYDARSLHTN